MPAAAALQSWSLLKYCSLGSPHGCALLLSFNLVVIVTFTCLHASMNLDLILYLFTISMPSIKSWEYSDDVLLTAIAENRN